MTQPKNGTEPAHEPRSKLSPYDTGDRCEPKSWIPYGTTVTKAIPAEDFGKVDFDDDEGRIVCVVHVERRADGGHVVHVDPQCSDDEISVVLHLRSEDVRLDGAGVDESGGIDKLTNAL
ncbi:hypothetical protein [Streptomyces sp. MMS24-I29]|uniref:hypothetical protein n=1 Tax=Streptomyces sp. MMS24-I29 TaxID=3351480 RepID=UPI003C7BBBA3